MIPEEPGGAIKQRIGLAGAPLLALGMLLFLQLDPAHPQVTRMAAVAVLMAGWWITEAIPIPATALLPVALLPALGVMPAKQVAGYYFNDVIFLFIGGFIFALAMQKWALHRRIALRIILLLGTGARRTILGFMTATWFLSMWISNTASTMMMVPMAMAIVLQFRETFGRERLGRYPVALLLGIAYAASVGGLATLIGTPPNLAFVRILKISFPAAPEISFARWFVFALPLSVIFLFITWALLCRLFVARGEGLRADPAFFRNEYHKLDRLRFEETVVLVLFGALVLLWMFRRDLALGAWTLPGWSGLLPEPGYIGDGTIAIAVALLLFLVPARSQGHGRLMDWETATRLHWGIVILFGGGFALAGGFGASGLSQWLSNGLATFGHLPPLVMVVAVCTMLTFLTELTSNTATTQMVLPVLAVVATAIRVHPLLLMVPATLSASCAFMLPVATPPNAIVFGSGEVRMHDMVRGGILLNLIGILLITAFVYVVGMRALGIEPGTMPAWAVAPAGG